MGIRIGSWACVEECIKYLIREFLRLLRASYSLWLPLAVSLVVGIPHHSSHLDESIPVADALLEMRSY